MAVAEEPAQARKVLPLWLPSFLASIQEIFMDWGKRIQDDQNREDTIDTTPKSDPKLRELRYQFRNGGSPTRDPSK